MNSPVVFENIGPSKKKLNYNCCIFKILCVNLFNGLYLIVNGTLFMIHDC